MMTPGALCVLLLESRRDMATRQIYASLRTSSRKDFVIQNSPMLFLKQRQENRDRQKGQMGQIDVREYSNLARNDRQAQSPQDPSAPPQQTQQQPQKMQQMQQMQQMSPKVYREYRGPYGEQSMMFHKRRWNMFLRDSCRIQCLFRAICFWSLPFWSVFSNRKGNKMCLDMPMCHRK